MTLLSKLLSLHHSEGGNRNEGGSCDSCGRSIGTPIKLTNLSGVTSQTYDACPFCFTRLEAVSTLNDLSAVEKRTTSDDPTPAKEPKEPQIEEEGTAPGGCPHQFGYLKKRPKNASIPESCLTCQRMIQCLLT